MKKLSRYFKISIGLIVIAICFLVGLKVGLFLFSQTRINTDITLINTDSTQANVNNQYESVQNQYESAVENDYCVSDIKFLEESDKNFCSQKSKIGGVKGLEIDLTANKALLYENEKLTSVLPLAYQSQEGKWYQAPTGYYFAGVKREKHLSSLFPVTMPYAFQYYEDFFIHGVPYYKNGEQVSSDFTGGCLRFGEGIAEQIFGFINPGDPVLVYKTFDDLELKEEFSAPVDLKDFWIRQRFNNPYRNSWIFGGTEYLKFDYYQHTGLDFAPGPNSEDKSVYSIYDGVVSNVINLGQGDHGFGNTVIIEHEISSTSSVKTQKIYSLYAHLSSIDTSVEKGVIIKKGEKIGEVGNSGYGCENYWRIGKDGCPSTSSGQVLGKADTHLHFELKKAPVLENPERGDVCQGPGAEWRFCYGSTPEYPQDYGYYDPTTFLFKKK